MVFGIGNDDSSQAAVQDPPASDDGDDDMKREAEELRRKNEELESRFAELDEKLNDPEYIEYLHKKKSGAANDDGVDDDPEPQFEPMDTENMTEEERFKELERRMSEKQAWLIRQTDKRVEKLNIAQNAKEQQRRKEELIKEISEFASSKEDFDDYKEKIREIIGKPMNIEQAYNYAKWRELAESARNQAGNRSAIRASSSGKPDGVERTFETVEDGAKAALDEVTSQYGNVL